MKYIFAVAGLALAELFTISCTNPKTAAIATIVQPGMYTYGVAAPGVGGNPIVLVYTLRLNPDAKTQPCILEIDGHLTMERYNCGIAVKRGWSEITFISLRPDHRSVGIESFKPDDVMLQIFNFSPYSFWFRWQKLKCDIEDTEKNLVFVKVSEDPNFDPNAVSHHR